MQKASLHKGQRLKSRSRIEMLFKNGLAFNSYPFRVVRIVTSAEDAAGVDAHLQAGFSVSARKFKKAVDRNRIKRLTKEAYRTQKQPLELLLQAQKKKLAVFFIYTGKELPVFMAVQEKMELILQRLIKICGEEAISNT